MPDFASFQPVLLWSDALVWLLVGVSALGAGQARRNALSRAAWARVGRSRPGMTAVTVLTAFVLIGLIDSLHYRPRLPSDHADAPPMDDIFDDDEEVNEYPDLKHKNYWID